MTTVGSTGPLKEVKNTSQFPTFEKKQGGTKKVKHEKVSTISDQSFSESEVERKKPHKQRAVKLEKRDAPVIFKKEISSQLEVIPMFRRASSSSSSSSSESSSPVLTPTEERVKADISKLKEKKKYDLKKAKELKKVVKELKHVYADFTQETGGDPFRRAVTTENREFKANIMSFESDEGLESYFILGEEINGLLGRGGYKDAFLAVNIDSPSHFTAIAVQRIDPDSKRTPAEITKEMTEEHRVGKMIQEAVGPEYIQTTRLITEFKDQGKEGVEISRVALVSDLCIGTYANIQSGKIDIKPEKLLSDFKHLLKTLRQVHEFGYAHRDVKRDNIFLDAKHNPKFADWGMAISRESLTKPTFEEACEKDIEKLVTTFSAVIWKKAHDSDEHEALKDVFIDLCRENNIFVRQAYDEKEDNEDFYSGHVPTVVKCNFQDLIDQTTHIEFNEKKLISNMKNIFKAVERLHNNGIAFSKIKPKDIYVVASSQDAVLSPNSPRMVSKKNPEDFDDLCKKNMVDLALLYGNTLFPPEGPLQKAFEQLCKEYEIELIRNENEDETPWSI